MIVHRLPAGDGHVLHVEEHGDPGGIPALVLHGGPGSGQSPVLRACLDAARYRIVCPDQRGAGQSTPAGSIAANTLAHLLADLRRVRDALGVRRWLVVGGSWGATLGLAHALDQPEAVSGLLLRNVFLARGEDIDAFFAGAVRHGGPAWQALQARAAAAGEPLLACLAKVLAEGSDEAQRNIATAWQLWEQRLSGEVPHPPGDEALPRLVQRYRIQSHFLAHGCWLADAPLLARCRALPPVPMRIVHGTVDAVCPPEGAAALQQCVGAGATLRWIEGAGHQATDPRTVSALRQAADAFACFGSFTDAAPPQTVDKPFPAATARKIRPAG